MDPINTRRGCDCACRNLTMPQLVKTSADHLKCLLKEDIIKLCRFHDISFEPWKPKGFLIKCLKDHIYYPPKDINIQNLCDHSIYLCCQSKRHYDKFYFDEIIDRIEPHEYEDYIFRSEDSDISMSYLNISGNENNNRADYEQVAQKTIECLKNCLPPELAGVAFLSGDRSRSYVLDREVRGSLKTRRSLGEADG